MYVKPIRPPDVVADAIARAVVGRTWSGTVAELLATIEAAAIGNERQDRAWPTSPAKLAACLRSQSDALRARGLRLSIMPADVLIERLRSITGAAPEVPKRPTTTS